MMLRAMGLCVLVIFGVTLTATRAGTGRDELGLVYLLRNYDGEQQADEIHWMSLTDSSECTLISDNERIYDFAITEKYIVLEIGVTTRMGDTYLSIIDRDSGETMRIIPRGMSMGWLPDNETLIFTVYDVDRRITETRLYAYNVDLDVELVWFDFKTVTHVARRINGISRSTDGSHFSINLETTDFHQELYLLDTAQGTVEFVQSTDHHGGSWAREGLVIDETIYYVGIDRTDKLPPGITHVVWPPAIYTLNRSDSVPQIYRYISGNTYLSTFDGLSGVARMIGSIRGFDMYEDLIVYARPEYYGGTTVFLDDASTGHQLELLKIDTSSVENPRFYNGNPCSRRDES
ncbi:MAG: hypothetical protein AAFV33_13050 [Chloroflexota bacterium]